METDGGGPEEQQLPPAEAMDTHEADPPSALGVGDTITADIVAGDHPTAGLTPVDAAAVPSATDAAAAAVTTSTTTNTNSATIHTNTATGLIVGAVAAAAAVDDIVGDDTDQPMLAQSDDEAPVPPHVNTDGGGGILSPPSTPQQKPPSPPPQHLHQQMQLDPLGATPPPPLSADVVLQQHRQEPPPLLLQSDGVDTTTPSTEPQPPPNVVALNMLNSTGGATLNNATVTSTVNTQQQLQQQQQHLMQQQQQQPPLPPQTIHTMVPQSPPSAQQQQQYQPSNRPADLADGGCADAAMPDEEETRSEATFRYRVENFSLLRDSVLSPPCYVRNLPWKIMVMPRNNPPAAGNAANDRPPVAGAGAAAPAVVDNRSLGFFLQCNGESESTSWSCNAIAELRLTSFRADTEPFLRKIKHLFYSKENDWGFSHFMSWPEILDPERGYVMDDAIELEVHVVAEAPHGVFWDSKKHTGYVGLKNQGATCYMNSLLQTLYFTNRLRQAVYKMPTEADDSSKSVALALQRVFHDLQFLDKPVGTKKLTKSFGWETLDSFMQHDVQEFLRVLLDKLESKMKRTCVEGTVPRLFEGKMASYIKCKNVDYTSTRQETFYDIQLNIKGKKNIAESFRDYVATETLEGDNKYDAGEHGLQEAEKGVIFVGFPPVLHLHLMRFQYDPITDSSVKFNDRFEFYEHINLDEYLQQPRGGNDAAATTTAEAAAADSTDGGSGAAAATGAASNEQRPAAPTTPPPEPADRADYTLHAVLVHSGDNHGGHYVVYINPTGDGRWCKFDDDVVSRCTKDEAILHNYGGVDDDITLHAKHCSNAYMLVYIRDSAMPQILQEIGETEIPTELTDRLHEERRMEQVRRRERAEANTYMTVNVLLEEYFDGHHTTDLFDAERVHFRVFKLKKTQTVGELIEQVADVLRTRKERLRLWPLIQRHNQITRLAAFEWRDEWQKALINCADMQNPWTVFVEQLPAGSRLLELPPFDRETQMLVFFKYYDPAAKRLNYVGLGYFGLQQRVAELAVEMCARVGWPVGQPVTVYEEQGANSVQRLTNLGETLERVLRYSPQSIRDIDGTVLIFERTQPQHQQPPPIATAASVAAAAATGPASAVSHGEAAASAAIGTAATPSAATTAAATATAATVVAGANVAAISAAAAAQAAAATAAAASAAAAVAAQLSGADTDADMPTVHSTTAGDGVVHSNSALGGGTTNLSNSALGGGAAGLNAAQSAAVAIGQTAAATAGIAVGRGELPQSTATGRSNPATITGPATPTGAAEPPSTQQQPLVSATALSTAVSNVVGAAPNAQLATAAASVPSAAAGHNLELPTCEDYFRDLLYRVEVTFIDKTVPTDGGFSLELSQRMTYDQMASAVGQKINSEPNKIQFFKCQNYKDIPGHPLRCNYEGNLKELLVYTKPKGAKKIFYQQLSMNIDELESKKQFKCLWLSINMKEEKELILFPNKNGTVKTLLEEAAKQIEFNFEEGSGQLRIVEVTNCKLLNGPQEDDLLEFLQASGETSITNPKIYRIEEVPRDEANLKDDEMLVPVSHFFKDVYNMFGVPFLVKTRQGEPFGALKERVRKKCAVPDKEWEKYKFALVSGGRIEYINDDDMPVSLADFRPAGNPPPVRTYLGLEHMNKTQKRSRFNYLEKAIKIYN